MRTNPHALASVRFARLGASRAPRAATSPINAMRHYLFGVFGSEARLALLAHGCDPTIGVLHARSAQFATRCALDAMEPRADVDAFCSTSRKIASWTARELRRASERHSAGSRRR